MKIDTGILGLKYGVTNEENSKQENSLSQHNALKNVMLGVGDDTSRKTKSYVTTSQGSSNLNGHLKKRKKKQVTNKISMKTHMNNLKL